MSSKIRKPPAGVEVRAYIHWNGKWRHVYIISGFDQQTILGEPAKMLEFRLTAKSRNTFASEKIHFHKNRPAVRKARGGDLV